MSGGRPLRFLAVVVGGWTAVRAAFLWPQIDPLPSLARAIVPPAVAMPAGGPGSATIVGTRRPRAVPSVRGAQAVSAAKPASAQRHAAVVSGILAAPSPRARLPDDPAPSPPPLRPVPIATPPDRLALSAWLIARGGERGAVSGGQLGASQAGVRVTYALGRRLALAARLSAPVEGRGKEAAIGVDWQPTSLPVHLVAEQRLALDGGRGGPTLLAIGGIDPTSVGLGFRLDAYGQAGGILRRGRVDAFADAAARLLHPAATMGRIRVDLGAGAWGGAQRGAARLDVGPTAAAIVPLGDRAVRIALDWRHRIAGRARPGSGPALTIGGDF